MAALLNDLSLIKDSNFIAESAGRKTVADVDGGFVTCDIIETAVDFGFSDWIERSSGFVRNDKRRVFIKSSAIAIFCASPPEISMPSESRFLYR